ncbi:MAG TPA: alpha/beta hydrolase [Gemmataceae bacterium]|nr:alpha/beta hydrolase [Gemmataceae bacterium]
MRDWILAGLTALAAALPAAAQPTFKTELDIVYSKPGERELKLDLARPADGNGPFPCVVCLHGGGWRLGNKRDLRGWTEFLAHRGYVAASIGYRLAPDATFPAQIEDAKTAVRFLRAHADRYGIDKDRFAVLGYSAGGHLACLLGLADEKCGFEGKECPDESSRVQAVVDYFGPTDLSGFAKDASSQRGVFGPFIGAKYADKPEAHDRASPIRYASRAAPPFLIFHGTKDGIVPIEQSRHLADRLRELGVSYRLVEVPDEGHGWSGRASAITTDETIQFLDAKLKKR